MTPAPDAAAAAASPIESLLVARDAPRYRGGAVVAKGGMGAIVEAADINLRRRVAMKVIRDQAEAKQSAEAAKAAEQTAKASEAKATAIEKTAIEKLGIAQATAPAFYEQARALIEDQKFEEALEKIAYALKVAPNVAEYHGLKGNLLQSLLRIKEAKEAYEAALKCPVAAVYDRRGSGQDGDGHRPPLQDLAAENLKLCEKILKDNPVIASDGGRGSVRANSGGGDGAPPSLLPSSLQELQSAMQQQDRTAEALAMFTKFGGDKEQIYAAWKTALEKAGWWKLLEKEKRELKQDEKGLLELNLRGLLITELKPIKGMPLAKLDLGHTKVSDLSPLKGMPLKHLDLTCCPNLKNLASLKGLPLETLFLTGCPNIKDLAPLKGMPLKKLCLDQSANIKDLAPLQGMALGELFLGGCPQFGNRDLAMLRGLPLTILNLNGTQVTDLRDLKDMPLTELHLTDLKVKDLSPLKGMKLTALFINGPLISDLQPIEGMPLRLLYLRGCSNIKDLSPLKGSPVVYLCLSGCSGLKDLTPLAECKELGALTLPAHCKGKSIEFLRLPVRGTQTGDLPKLGRLCYEGDPQNAPPAEEFWKKYGGGGAKK
ncbi:MAG: hypothetical protein HY360_04610 [Verrucomicrobia bacterium]|nr:hypothetical protein [Verrucomicrobiota bacterium]